MLEFIVSSGLKLMLFMVFLEIIGFCIGGFICLWKVCFDWSI